MAKQTAEKRKLRVRAMAPVVDLAAARLTRKHQLAERRLRAVLDDNRAALGRLFASGLIFTQKGSRTGRELLSAHQALLKVVALLGRMSDGASESDLRSTLGGNDLFLHLESQLARTAQLTARTGEFLSGRYRE